MINASKEFNQVVYGQENKIYVGKATIKLYDNTVLEVDSSEIWQGGIEITEQTSNSNNFDIGFCSCKQLVLKIKNTNNEFSSYDFYDAEIVPFVGLELSETTEYIKKGVFTVDDPVSQGPYISLTCMDNMHKLDKNVTSLSGSTAGQLVLNVANACGVTLANVNFDGHNIGLDVPENVAEYTYRQVLSYICQVTGSFAYFDTDGNLAIKWYDTGAFEQADSLDGGAFDGQTTDKLYGLPEGTMESAGRNLIPNSNFSKDVLDGWSSPYGTHQIKNSFYIATLTRAHPSASRAEYYTGLLEPGIYTFSMLAKSEKGFRYNMLEGTEYELKNIEGSQGFKISYISFEVTEPQQVYIRMYFNNPEVGDAMEIDWAKLEKGPIPTPWTPAPEDVSPYQSGDNADGGDFTYTEQTHYDGGTFKQAEKYHHIYSLYSANISTDDVIITGIRVTNDEDTYLYGEEGYILEIEDNPFSIGKEQEIAAHLGQKIIGMQFRPLNVTAQSNPLVEAGDPAYVSHKGNTYKCFITSSTFAVGQSSQLSCEAESYQGRRVQGLSASTKNIIQARRVVKKEISTYDLEQQRFNNLVFHSFGLYRTEEVLEDGSTIEYAHDKPTLTESQNIWRQSADVFAVSNDGGVNWRGMDADGNIIANVLNAIGVNAEWINVLTNFKVGNNFNVDANGNLIATNADIKGKITATSGSFTGSINSNSANITGGTFRVTSSDERFSSIILNSSSYSSESSASRFVIKNMADLYYAEMGGGALYMGDYSGNTYTTNLSMHYDGSLYGDGNLVMGGTKNRVVNTPNYGKVLLNAYETPKPTFADTGHAQIGDDGLCYIDIDLVFLETIDQTHDYRYFLTKYGKGDIWIKESNTDYFIVEGTPNLKFDWKIEAVQRDYNTYNLEKFEGEGQGIEEVDYINLADEYLHEHEKEMIIV